MEKNIQKLLRMLQLEIILVALVAIAVIVLGQTDVINNGIVMPKSQEEFVLNTVSIGLALIGIPLALKLFQLNTTRGLRRMNLDEALLSYHNWSLLRMGILGLAAVFGFVVYYLTTTTTGVLCALASLAILFFFCWPSRKKIDEYLEQVKREN